MGRDVRLMLRDSSLAPGIELLGVPTCIDLKINSYLLQQVVTIFILAGACLRLRDTSPVPGIELLGALALNNYRCCCCFMILILMGRDVRLMLRDSSLAPGIELLGVPVL